MSGETEKADLEIIQRAIDLLGERFDTVQILVVGYFENCTLCTT